MARASADHLIVDLQYQLAKTSAELQREAAAARRVALDLEAARMALASADQLIVDLQGQLAETSAELQHEAVAARRVTLDLEAAITALAVAEQRVLDLQNQLAETSNELIRETIELREQIETVNHQCLGLKSRLETADSEKYHLRHELNRLHAEEMASATAEIEALNLQLKRHRSD
jgi:chromosome segregation ATPase